jgi:hypothetical protein
MIKIIYNVIILTLFVGILYGPISWGYSYTFSSEYDSFSKDASTTFGIIEYKYEKLKYRYVIHSVTINYAQNAHEKTETIEIEAPLWSSLKVGEKIELLYNQKMEPSIRIKIENQSQYLPPLKKAGYGKWITIISYTLFIFFILNRKRIVAFLNK